MTTTYAVNKAGQLASLTVGSAGHRPYVYDGFGLMASRTVNTGVASSALHMVYDQDGDLIAEADATTGLTEREYLWLEDRPLAVVNGVDTGSPAIYHVHADQLGRPVLMTGPGRGILWRATFRPFGEVQSITGSASLDARYTGQWFMLEAGCKAPVSSLPRRP